MDTRTDGPPESLPEIGSPAGMSNFDFSVDPGVEGALRAGDAYTCYAGWNFHGKVWWDGEQFACQVWTYHTPRETIRAATLEELMHAVSSEYGYD